MKKIGINSPDGGRYTVLMKGLFVMKIVLFLILTSTFNLLATGTYSQTTRMSLSLNQTSIKQVLKEIERSSEFYFLYNNDLIDVERKVDIQVDNELITSILDRLFDSKTTRYAVYDKQIVISPAGMPFPQEAQRKVSGKVTDQTGAGIPGATVAVKGLSVGIITDSEGRFNLTIPSDAKVLVFSFVGMNSQEVPIDNKKTFNIVLSEANTQLEEVVAVGYGSMKKSDLTGTVNSIAKEEIVKSPTGNVMEAVQGKISGVDITRTSGGAGAGINITVRGNRSINAGNDPLYIVDGIQYTNIQDVNPNDVLSMDILKDASATAIYGSRGANGVILITTKRGAEGKVKVTASMYYGISDVAGYPKPMNATQFTNFKRQAYKTYGRWNSIEDDPKIFTPTELASINANTNTYWPGLLLNQGSQEDYVVSISGGTAKTKVYFSFDYFKEKGLLNNDYSNRYTLRTNIDQSIFNNFKVGLESQFTYYDQNLRSDNILSEANKDIPYFSPYNEDGTLAKFPGNGGLPSSLLDEASGVYVNQNHITRLLSIAYAEWEPLKGLVIRSNLGLVNESTRNGHFEDANTIIRIRSSGSLSSIANITKTDLTWENIITYQKNIGAHLLNFTAVTSYLSNRSDNSKASGTGQLLADQSFYALQNNPANLAISSNYIGSNLESAAFRFNYSFKGKYLLSFTGREDGASVLASKNRWSFFPSTAIAWRINEEKFMKNLSVISNLKLRGSIGVAGNSAVNPYQTQSSLMLIPFSLNNQTALAYGLQPQTGNINLNWELTTTKNFGIDFGLSKNRISGSIDIYDSKTKDLLYLQQLPTTTGVQSILNNSGRTRNSGLEISLKTVNIQSNNFSWISNISYARNKERIVYLPNGDDIANNLIIGSPVNSFYDYQKIGIWQTSDLAMATIYGYKPGDIRVLDVNKDDKITALNDRMVVGSAVPDYIFGFSNDVKFKSFDLNIFLDARVGQTFVSRYALKFEPDAIENGAVVDYWTPENPTNDYPQPDSRITKEGLPFVSTLGYKDGSFLKVRNITLGYTIPSYLAQKFHVTTIRWYVSAKNYFTFSKVKDYDPEGGGSFETPLTKLVVTGLKIEF